MGLVLLIVGTIAGIVGLLWAIDSWLLPEPVIRPWILRFFRQKPRIQRVYAPLTKESQFPAFFHGMAIGILCNNISPDIETNMVFFRQPDNHAVKTCSISGSQITGGSHAPGPTVLTVPVPAELSRGQGEVSIKVEEEESNSIQFNVLGQPIPPTLTGFGTPFASKRTTSGAHGKRIVIGGCGFSIVESENKVIFATNGGVEAHSTPEKVRGDALLGVVVPTGLPIGEVRVQVETLIRGTHSGLSNDLRFNIVMAPKLSKADSYVRLGEDLRIWGCNFDKGNEDNNWVILEPYQDRKPISLPVKSVPTENEIVVQIPRSNLPPGPYDLRVIVDGNYSTNSLILDIQRGGSNRALEERSD